MANRAAAGLVGTHAPNASVLTGGRFRRVA